MNKTLEEFLEILDVKRHKSNTRYINLYQKEPMK